MLLTMFLCGHAFAHSGKPKYHVIIDTDGALDDMRSISMFLSGNEIRVLAISCSQGTLLPDSVFVKVTSLLSAYHHEGIPVGISEGINVELPAWAPFARSIPWGNELHTQNLKCNPGSIELLNHAVEDYPDKVTLVALGSLKTYADWLKANRDAPDKIERIIWYNNHNLKEGFNYNLSPDSYDYIKQSGIKLEIVANGRDDLYFNQDYINQIHNTRSIYTSRIEDLHSRIPVKETDKSGHLHLWDDMLPLYLTVPVMFDIRSEQNLKFISIYQQLPPVFIYETIGKLLISSASSNNRVFITFPADTLLYKPEYAAKLNSTVDRFGLTEWRAICLTNEIHGHTGIYSIIGAKMGIRAMEFFNVGVNNLKLLTFAGSKPPLSCFNDGIQVSTGATLGQGLITVADSISVIPSAIFEFNHQKVHLSLKPEIAAQMRYDIEYGVTHYGLLSEMYWIYIEELALKYWTDLDRQEIFSIQKL